MFSTPVAMLETSTRSPPMCRAMSARSGMVAITLIFESAGASAAGPSRVRMTNAIVRRFMSILLGSAIFEAVDVTAEDDRPLQEELVLVEARLLETRVLQTQAIELGEPHRQIRRVGRGVPRHVVQVLRIVEEEAGVIALGEARLEVRVEAGTVAALEDERRRGRGRRVGERER